MGLDRRLIALAPSCALLFALSACGESAKEQERRELLTPPNKVAIKAAKKEQAKVANEDGELLESDQLLAGFPVPRGFQVRTTYTDEWVLESMTASALATASYVEKHVFTGSITRTSAGGYRFDSAQLRKNMSLPRVAIRVSPIKGKKHATELRIRKIPVQPAVPRPPADVVEAKMREARKFAQ